jgi:hypothetical protein
VGLALVEADDHPADAFPALDRIRAAFLQSGRPIEAAWCDLDAVSLLIDTDHFEEAAQLASRLYEFFAEANLPQQAIDALHLLRQAVTDGQLTSELVDETVKKVLAAK